MIHQCITIGFLSLVSVGTWAQDSLAQNLRFYGDVMINASLPENRQRAGDAFYTAFKAYLTQSDESGRSLKALPWLTVIAPPDSTFRLITWQVELDQVYRYYGFLQDLSGNNPNVEFIDKRPLGSQIGTFAPEQWYGAIYYGIQPFTLANGGQAYVLLGFNAYNQQLNQRVADILFQDGNGQFRLGLPLFHADTTGQEMLSRVVVEYADAVAGTMRFDREKQMLIYDHMIPVNTPEGTTFAPDGSYQGYQLQDGQWHLIDKVFTVISETPPGGRAQESTKRDLLGRPVDEKKH